MAHLSILNPLGVPSRMNVVDLETHLGNKVRLGKQIGDAVEAARASGDTKALRAKFEDTYPNSQYDNRIKPMNDEQVIEQSELLSRGVPMATPVFDLQQEKLMLSTCLIRQVCHKQVRNGLLMGRTGKCSTAL